jgi:hypothetical protein
MPARHVLARRAPRSGAALAFGKLKRLLGFPARSPKRGQRTRCWSFEQLEDRSVPSALSGASVVVLDPTAAGALTLVGNAQINANAPVIIDSNNAAAVRGVGNAQLNTPQIDITGGSSLAGHAALNGQVRTGAAATTDPLAGIAAPDPSQLPLRSSTALQYSRGSQTLLPGLYEGGITFTGGSLTLTPGVYYLDGGGLTASGSGSIVGNGVMIYDAPGASGQGISITGNVTLTLSPPTSGAYQGIVVFQDRASSAPFQLAGNSAANISGTVYLADAPAAVRGNGRASQVGSQFISRTLTLSGNGTLTFNYDPAVVASGGTTGGTTGGGSGGTTGGTSGGTSGGSSGGTTGGTSGGTSGGSTGSSSGGTSGSTSGGSSGGSTIGGSGGSSGGTSGATSGGTTGGTTGGSTRGSIGGSSGGISGGPTGGTSGIAIGGSGGASSGANGGAAGGTSGTTSGGAAGGATGSTSGGPTGGSTGGTSRGATGGTSAGSSGSAIVNPVAGRNGAGSSVSFGHASSGVSYFSLPMTVWFPGASASSGSSSEAKSDTSSLGTADTVAADRGAMPNPGAAPQAAATAPGARGPQRAPEQPGVAQVPHTQAADAAFASLGAHGQFESGVLWSWLDRMEEAMDVAPASRSRQAALAATLSLMVSVGFVVWKLYTNYLLATAAAGTPLWKRTAQQFDPLAILESWEDQLAAQEEAESLRSLVA